ncbi:MAG: oligopeptide transporter, OPT family [Candidatus Thermoplasmatota archaeon]|nr:oligopeptide transporter, OPT family [Candidatus Thermoplasmatota archaeon]MBU1940250.1 oligopeptide transporter, OPT family [Candidatus Thermoplasmatota archaeon]
MSSRENFKTFIPANVSIPEFTFKAVLVGALLAIVLGSANAYFGLYAGMTVSAAIPGAVLAFAFLKPLKGTILEVNIGMMGAASGASLAAGVIFTIPAMLILGAWTEIQYVETTIVAMLGGILGVLWMVSLRRALIIKTDLPFPEGVAVAAVLATTVGDGKSDSKAQTGVSGVWLLCGSLLGAMLKFGQVGLHAFSGKLHGIIDIGRFNIGGGEHAGLFYGGLATSPALLGVGWIIGPRIGSFVFIGGLLGWVIMAPLIVVATGIPIPSSADQITDAMALAGGNFEVGKVIWGFYTIWSDYIRYIGVGAMVVGGLFTIFKLRNNISEGIREAISGIKGGQKEAKKRTEQDLNFKYVFLLIGFFTIPVFLLYAWISDNYLVSGVMAVFAILFAFIASAIGGYMAGLVGSSNNPTSGVTVSVLLITSLILLGFGLSGSVGAYGVALLIAAVIACCAAISGDVLQSMTAGQIIGATPAKQQLAEIVGIIAAAPVLALVVSALDKAYDIGSTNLPAPQAFLMSGIVRGVLGGEMVWPFVIAGMVLAFVLILINVPVLPVAIGIYLPFTLSTPIFCGGIIRYITNKKIEKQYGCDEEQISEWELAIKQTEVKPRERILRTGLLFTAGLIAGEALTGVIVAFIIISGLNISMFEFPPEWPGLLLWLFIAFLVFYIPLREIYSTHEK